MAEGTYESECMRAELLGVDPPNYEEFMKKKKEQEAQQVENEDLETENLKETEAQSEGLKGVSGGLDELNNILSITQKKIDKFKVRCGSITNLLKIKVGSITGDGKNSEQPEDGASAETGAAETGASVAGAAETDEATKTSCDGAPLTNGSGNTQKKSDLTKALDNHVDKLDSMLEKAENAQYSMAHQNKQMKKFLK